MKEHALQFGRFIEANCVMDENELLILYWVDAKGNELEIKGITNIYEKFLETIIVKFN